MDIYWAFARLEFKKFFAYRSSVVFGLIGAIIGILAQIAIWAFIFNREPEQIRYMSAYVICATLLAIVYTFSFLERIQERVSSGNIVTDLIKPMNLTGSLWAATTGEIGAKLLTRGLPLVILFIPILLQAEISFRYLPLCVVISILNFGLFGLIYYLIGHLAFVLIEIWPFRRLAHDTIRLFSGAVVPLPFFPEWFITLADMTPFPLLYSFPIRSILGDLNQDEIIEGIGVQALWLAGLYLFFQLVHRRSLRRLIVQGG